MLKESAAVFDFDGTLVDSFTPRKNTHKKVSAFLLDQLGWHDSEDNVRKMTDIISKIDIEMHQNRIYDRNLWWAKVLRRYSGKPADLPESAITETSVLYWESIKKKSTIYPGTKSMLQALKREGIKLGLISDTDGTKGMKTERIEASGLAAMFDATVVAGEETANVKPDAEPYTLIVDRLKTNAASCVSIGDNPGTDVDGALRTGMKVIIIKNKLVPQTANSQRYYLVERGKLTKFITDTLRGKSPSGRP